MAADHMYVTLTYVDSARLKCANANCSRQGEDRNRIDGAQLLAQVSSGVHLWVRLYFCDECYPRYKAALERLALIAEAAPSVPPNWHIEDGCTCDVCELARAIRGEHDNPYRGPDWPVHKEV